AAFFQQVIERLQTLPGVRAAGAAYPLPLSGAYEGNSFGIQGRPTAPGEILTAGPHWISPDYFRVLGIRLLKGRVFAESDGSDAPRVIVINQVFVRRYFPLEEPIGKRLALNRGPDGTPVWREIVGVMQDVKHTSLDSDPTPEMYIPFSHFPIPFMTLVVRTAG